MTDYENWNDEYQDDIEFHGMPLIRQGQSNSPKVLEGVFGIGDFLMPNGLVAKGCFQFLAIGCDTSGSTGPPIAAACLASCRARRRLRALTG